MNIVQRVAFNLSGYAHGLKASRPIAFVAGYLSNLLWLIDTTWRSLVRQGYGQNAVVYACIRLLSQSVAEPPLKAYKDGATPEERKELDKKHPLIQLIHQPNELMTEYELKELITIQVSVAGRSVWWKERSVGGQPIALWPLRPDRIGAVYADPGETRVGQKVLAGYSYVLPGTSSPMFLPRQDCLSVNFPDPDGESGGMVEGFSPLSAIAREVAADNAATLHVGSLLANYAQPGIALEMQDGPQSEEDATLIKAKFRQEFGGQRVGVPAIVGAGTKIIPLGFTLKDLEFPALRDNAEARITAAFGVPAVLVGIRVGLSEANQRATVMELKEHFTETTLMSYWRRLADQFTLELAVEFGEGLVCEFDTSNVRALAGQFAKQIAPWKEAFAAGGLMVNEYRGRLKLPALDPEVGDVLYIPTSVTVVPATEKARAAIQKRQQVEQAAAAEQQAQARQAELDQQAELAKLNPPPEAPQLPPGEQPKQLTAGQPQESVAVGANGRQAGQGSGQQGALPAGPVHKSGEIVVIPLDDELAAALGVPATGYIVAGNGQRGN